MHARRVAALAACFVLGLVVTTAAPTPAAAQSGKKGVPKAPPRLHVYKVQIRHPGWKVAGRFPTALSAKVAAAQLRRVGWHTQVRNYRGAHITRVKMPRWKTRAVVANRLSAEVVAHHARATGFQARVIRIQ
jgi:hypothetical protein